MTIFATLPADVRRALARAELRRRRVPVHQEPESAWHKVLPFMSTPHLERLLETQGSSDPGVLQVQIDALADARARMLITQQPEPPAPPITQYAAWNDHQELFRFAGPATAEHLAAVDSLLETAAQGSLD